MKQLMILLSSIMLSFGAYAADKGATQKHTQSKAPEWTKEQRETMAKNHESLAACLRSDKAIAACHDEMMKSCKDNETCPMKGRMGMHHGMMQDDEQGHGMHRGPEHKGN